ncbi:divIVA domain protein [Mycobacterium kansasii]|uniref:DivIVA domain protein n=1 Tax=Mycobacterium kansasii TaxID=1768 RepID=A0A1V3WZZ4_MYCKA|nr:divIVA domain protein [Mycobacterium kansasii]
MGAAVAPVPAPPEASSASSSAIRWRRSEFSSMSRVSSFSTRSRKASTSSSLYPRLPIGGLLNATLWTSAGVSGIVCPLEFLDGQTIWKV